MHNIFISYRRDDNQDATGRIYDRLRAHLKGCQVFKDVDSIPFGVDFRKHLSHEVGQCDVLLAVVGQRWVDAQDDAGNRRLDAPSDFVRIEIEAAMARGIPVIPVLVGNASMPLEAALPPSLSAFAFLNAAPIRPDPDFHRDMDRLIDGLRNWLEDRSTASGLMTLTGKPVVGPPGSPAPVPKEPLEEPQLVAAEDSDRDIPEAEVANLHRYLDGLSVGQAGLPIANVMATTQEIHRDTGSRAVPVLCHIIRASSTSDLDRYKAISVLNLALRLPGPKPPAKYVLETLLNYGALTSASRNAALEAVAKAQFSPDEKWAALLGVIPFVDDRVLGDIVSLLLTVTPPPERHRTGAILLDLLATAQSWPSATRLCQALKAFNYRTGIPRLIGLLQVATPAIANCIADVLVGWRVIESGPAIQAAIENARYGTDSVGLLLKLFYALEGPAAAPYVTMVLGDALPAVQADILRNLVGVTDSMIGDTVTELARNSLDVEVRNAADRFLAAGKTA